MFTFEPNTPYAKMVDRHYAQQYPEFRTSSSSSNPAISHSSQATSGHCTAYYIFFPVVFVFLVLRYTGVFLGIASSWEKKTYIQTKAPRSARIGYNLIAAFWTVIFLLFLLISYLTY